MTQQDQASAQGSVSIDDNGVITIIVRGVQTGESVRKLGNELRKALATLSAQGKKSIVFCDMRALKLSDLTSSARLEGRRLMELHIDKSAVVGEGYLVGIISYLFQFSRNGTRRFFTDEKKARKWLKEQAKPHRARATVSLVLGITIGLIGILALVGWQIGNEYLIRWIPTLRPINPVAAVGLIAISYGFISYYFGKLVQLKVAGIFGILLGIAALSPLDIDHLLFSKEVVERGLHTNLADSAGFCFIAIGLSPFTVGTKKFWVRVLQYVLACIILGMALFNIYAQLYIPDFIYDINDTFVMAFNLAFAFLLTGITLVLIILYRKAGNVLVHVSRIGWLIVAALVGVQALTYGGWYQAEARNRSDSTRAFNEQTQLIQHELDQRSQAYIDSLYGFRGLFAASDYVDQGEFQSYFKSLNLDKTYPGIRALSFISKVNDRDLSSFVQTHQKDKSLHPGGNPTFVITSKSNLPTHYILTYNASTNTVGGSDLGSMPTRLAAFQKADASNAPVASTTLEFAGASGQVGQKGFFLTIPVSNKNNTSTIGYVNAVFNYADFFNNAFAAGDLTDLNIAVQDKADGETIYQKATKTDDDHVYSQTVTVADRTWDLNITASANFGVGQSQSELPDLILIGGQLFSVFMLIIFIMQSRARQQAIDLAENITEDLQAERNTAVANDRKSNAILTSIGDAVFAINKKGHITLFNPAAARLSGYSDEEALGKPYEEVLRFIFEDSKRPHNSFIKQALTGHVTSMKNHTALVRKDGSEVAVADSAAPIKDAKGNILGAIIVFRDVSKEQALDKAKTEFVSLASHQLRTPLSAINWFSEMLLNGDAGKINKDQHEYLSEIYEGNQRMIELVDSLLNVSRLEVGKLKNDPQPTSLQELTSSLMKELQTTIANREMNVSLKIPPKLPTVFADPKLLRMVIQNLMTNAIKYTAAKGHVALTIREATHDDIQAGKFHTGHYAYISVADNGFGIPVQQQAKIFEKLFRADNVRKLDVEGTGLGLYIVKEVAEKLGGTIWFESTEGRGTTFHVLVPFKTEAT